LNVKGIPGLLESLKEYCADEKMGGDNKYDAGDKFGMQVRE
jgi:hypothetical protein